MFKRTFNLSSRSGRLSSMCKGDVNFVPPDDEHVYLDIYFYLSGVNPERSQLMSPYILFLDMKSMLLTE